MTDADPRNVRRALDWFLSFLGTDEWNERKAEIEDHLQSIHPFGRTRGQADLHSSVSTALDTIHWYLYLAENALTSAAKREPIQDARILPVFRRLGAELEALREVEGASEKARDLVQNHPELADSTLFEFLVATLWKRNGWAAVSFVPESATTKTPDLIAQSGKSRWAIECKRLSKSSGYSVRERQKWFQLWRPLSSWLVNHGYAVVLDIVFHVELETLPDDFMVDELRRKLPLLAIYPSHIISNDVWDVEVALVDFERAAEHLRRYYVKCPSGQMAELIGGRRDPNRGFTYVVGGRIATMGTGHVFDKFMDTMDFAACAFWHCDAARSIEVKARDVRGRLADAVRQLPKELPSAVHIGLETLDGVAVEAERYRRIFNTVSRFDTDGKSLKWVFCHLFQSYAPPDQDWVLDETVYYFATEATPKETPLRHFGAIMSESELSSEGVHWLRDPP